MLARERVVKPTNPFRICNNCSSIEKLDEFFIDGRMRVLVEYLAPVIFAEGNNSCAARQTNRQKGRKIKLGLKNFKIIILIVISNHSVLN
jgi:hypothetical protein